MTANDLYAARQPRSRLRGALGPARLTEIIFSNPNPDALQQAILSLRKAQEEVRASKPPSEKALVQSIHVFLLAVQNAEAIRDAVYLVAGRSRFSWSTSGWALPALVRIIAPGVPERREYSIADVLWSLRGMAVDDAELRLKNAGGVDKLARMSAEDRLQLRARWERDLPYLTDFRVIDLLSEARAIT